MKRLIAGCLMGALSLTLAGTAFAQAKPAAPAAAEKKSTRIRPVRRTIHGNPGFHYGSGYNVYRMHIAQPAPSAEKK